MERDWVSCTPECDEADVELELCEADPPEL
jgi:hypothetical protein